MIRAEIINALVQSIVRNGTQVEKMKYTDLYYKTSRRLGRKISHRDYNSHLKCMLDDQVLDKAEVGNRGYSLTEKGYKQYQLKILGIGNDINRRVGLYQSLICFDIFKRGQLLNDKQLEKFLTKIGRSRDSLTKIEFLHENDLKIVTAFVDPTTGLEIIQYTQDKFESRLGETTYYVVMEGFSVEEFIAYTTKLRNRTEPRPLSKYMAHIPYVRFEKYSKEEVENLIHLLEGAGLIKPAFFKADRNELRFRVADSLLNVIGVLTMIETAYFHAVAEKMIFFEKPDEDDREFIIRYMGERGADRFIALASKNRREFLNNTPVQKEDVKNLFARHLNCRIKDIILQFKDDIDEFLKDEFLMDLLLPLYPYYLQ